MGSRIGRRRLEAVRALERMHAQLLERGSAGARRSVLECVITLHSRVPRETVGRVPVAAALRSLKFQSSGLVREVSETGLG